MAIESMSDPSLTDSTKCEDITSVKENSSLIHSRGISCSSFFRRYCYCMIKIIFRKPKPSSDEFGDDIDLASV